ncbi:gas vesicle protein [Nocardioides iriomotensis]|uniref:Gas vesicle protein n=1 Tax=Nocardioides iriomotensis TaxID=715784 RepID=A0A4Q5IX21_9ACTN|nr:gas vesicle protein [Nocardioides iriomotensis]RYU10670.1 gas vesicle protein [Nocardioides iriomotensis]
MATDEATKKTATKATKKAPAKKSTAKKSTAEEAPAKKSAKKAPAKKAAKKAPAKSSAPRASAPRRRSGMTIAAEAAQRLVELTGRDVEGITALERTDDGWVVEVDVLEVRRIPDTTDVLATYELTLDEDGEIDGYRRLRRYVRGTPEDGRS